MISSVLSSVGGFIPQGTHLYFLYCVSCACLLLGPSLALSSLTLSNTHRLMTTAARGSTYLTTASLEQRLGRGTLTRRSGRTVWGRRDTCLRTYPSRTMRSTVEIRSRREPQRRDQRHRCLRPLKSRYQEEESTKKKNLSPVLSLPILSQQMIRLPILSLQSLSLQMI